MYNVNISGAAVAYLLDEGLVGGAGCGDHICLEAHLGQLDCHVAHTPSTPMHQHPRPGLQVARLQGLP